MKTALLLSIALAAFGDAAPTKPEAKFSWAELLNAPPTPNTRAPGRLQSLREAFDLPPETTIAPQQLRAESGQINTANMCGAFQEKANGTTNGYKTVAGVMKVPQLSWRNGPGGSASYQTMSVFVGLDGIRCPGLEVGAMLMIKPNQTQAQTSLAYVRYPTGDAFSFRYVPIAAGDTLAAAVSVVDATEAYIVVKNLNTGDQDGDYHSINGMPCETTAAWTVGGSVFTDDAKAPVDRFPSFSSVRFAYMDANRTDGSSNHLDGSTFTTLLYPANGTQAARPFCQGTASKNATNELLIASL